MLRRVIYTATLFGCGLATFDPNDEQNVRIPRHEDGSHLSLNERVRLLELRLGGHQNVARDPFFAMSPQSVAACRKPTYLCDDGRPQNANLDPCTPGLYDHPICLDHGALPWRNSKKRQCVVYDFGVRQQPQFGMVLATRAGCEVHAFDPSPVALQWFNAESKAGRIPPNYHFHEMGAGGVNGNIKLREYGWEQVSILRLPTIYQNCSGVQLNRNEMFKGQCPHERMKMRSFDLNVNTLGAIMARLGHTRIDVLKLDVEGSEYAFLEDAIDTGAINAVQQLAIEWHHYGFDVRYGHGSSPALNSLVTVLAAHGLLCWFVHDQSGGWPTTEAIWPMLNMHDVRYNLASFRRLRKSFAAD